ncbi:hypothetical protein MNV49_006409 [Pseudohyphozyma bogoriensis]|nr:hypothetical protein MNV49_006409 [Pseudohyphozyma bogoriensis]
MSEHHQPSSPSSSTLSPKAPTYTPPPPIFTPVSSRPRAIPIRAPPPSAPTLSTAQFRKTIVCRFFKEGYCHRGKSCFYAHELEPSTNGEASGSSSRADDDTETCAICLEVVSESWGLLENCSHGFHFACIRGWRESKKKEKVRHEKEETDCPLCRASSSFITPSSRYFPQGEEKERLTKSFKDKMKQKPCNYLAKSMREGQLHCPFRNDCYYSHVIPGDTAPYVFPPRPPRRSPVHVYRPGDSLRYSSRREHDDDGEEDVMDRLVRLLMMYRELEVSLADFDEESDEEEEEYDHW